MIFRFANFVIDVDVDRTREFYGREGHFVCTCQNCRNYDKAILTAPATVLDFLESIGIDPRKPAEVYGVKGELEEDGTLWYNGWYHICGTIVECPKTICKTVGNHDFYSYETNAEYAPDADYPFSVLPEKNLDLVSKDFPTPVLQLEIDARLPWVLPESYQT